MSIINFEGIFQTLRLQLEIFLGKLRNPEIQVDTIPPPPRSKSPLPDATNEDQVFESLVAQYVANELNSKNLDDTQNLDLTEPINEISVLSTIPQLEVPLDEVVDIDTSSEEAIVNVTYILPSSGSAIQATSPQESSQADEGSIFSYQTIARQFNSLNIRPVSNEDVEEFMNTLATGKIDPEIKTDRIELILREALKRVDLIGNLTVSRHAFDLLCERLYFRLTNSDGRPQLSNAKFPAIFVVTMVFCARYSEEMARNFWKPYAYMVWRQSRLDQYLQNSCREFFIKSRIFLEEELGLVFHIHSTGDVVRPIYQHAIIPAYLQDDFARWMIDLEAVDALPDFSDEILYHTISENDRFSRLAPTLRRFVADTETRATAISLIRRMISARLLLLQGENSLDIHNMLSSPIEQQLWRQIEREISVNSTASRRTPRNVEELRWVWSLQDDQLCLHITNLRFEGTDQPNLLLWANINTKVSEMKGQLEYLSPWSIGDGWLIDDLVIADGEPEGRVYVLSQTGNVLREFAVPPIPLGPFQLFRITQQNMYGVPVDLSLPITDGEWLLSFQSGVEIFDSTNTTLEPRQRYSPPALLEEVSTHKCAGQYTLKPPIIVRDVQNGETIYHIERRASEIRQPRLFGEQADTSFSASTPPVYRSRAIYLDIPMLGKSWRRTIVSVRCNGAATIKRMETLEQQGLAAFLQDDIFRINIGDLIDDAPGCYDIFLHHDLRPLMPVPLQFTYIPNAFEFAPPDSDTCYTPVHLPRVVIKGVELDQVLQTENIRCAIQEENRIEVTWHDLTSPECHLRLKYRERIIPLSWTINRIDAWISGLNENKQLIGEAPTVHVRGTRGSKIDWIVKGEFGFGQRTVTLDAKGRYDGKLKQDALWDLVREQRGVNVEIWAAYNHAEWLVSKITRNELPRRADPLKVLREKQAQQKARPVTVERRAETNSNGLEFFCELIEILEQTGNIILHDGDFLKLVSLPNSILNHASLEQLKQLWPSLSRIAEVHDVPKWIETHGSPPIWIKPGYYIAGENIPGPADAVDRKFTVHILQQPRMRYTRHPSHLTRVEGYRYVTETWIDNMKKRSSNRQELQKLTSNASWGRALKKCSDTIHTLPDQKLPMIIPAIRLNSVLCATIDEDYRNDLLRLDSYVFLIALLLRMKAYYSTDVYLVQKEAGLSDVMLTEILKAARQACPELLEWSLTWAELFYVHTTLSTSE